MARRYLNNICLDCFGDLDKHDYCSACRTRSTHKPKTPFHLPPYTMLNDRYLVGRGLGQGGFGITYCGWDTKTSEKIAIKEFFPRSICSRDRNTNSIFTVNNCYNRMFSSYKDMFVNEVRLLIKARDLTHIVKVLDFFLANNSVYCVMEYLEGINLRSFILNYGGKISLDSSVTLLLPIMESLRTLHNMGMIHRDVSPENIIVNYNYYAQNRSDQYSVKLIDFGAAINYTQNYLNQFAQLKPGFAPLEQYTTNLLQGPWTDVYGVAATLYACCSGTVPPPASKRARHDTLISLSRLGVRCDQKQQKAIQLGLAVHASDRYQSMSEFIVGLCGADDERLENPRSYYLK